MSRWARDYSFADGEGAWYDSARSAEKRAREEAYSSAARVRAFGYAMGMLAVCWDGESEAPRNLGELMAFNGNGSAVYVTYYARYLPAALVAAAEPFRLAAIARVRADALIARKKWGVHEDRYFAKLPPEEQARVRAARG